MDKPVTSGGGSGGSGDVSGVAAKVFTLSSRPLINKALVGQSIAWVRRDLKELREIYENVHKTNPSASLAIRGKILKFEQLVSRMNEGVPILTILQCTREGRGLLLEAQQLLSGDEMDLAGLEKLKERYETFNQLIREAESCSDEVLFRNAFIAIYINQINNDLELYGATRVTRDAVAHFLETYKDRPIPLGIKELVCCRERLADWALDDLDFAIRLWHQKVMGNVDLLDEDEIEQIKLELKERTNPRYRDSEAVKVKLLKFEEIEEGIVESAGEKSTTREEVRKQIAGILWATDEMFKRINELYQLLSDRNKGIMQSIGRDFHRIGLEVGLDTKDLVYEIISAYKCWMDREMILFS